MGGRQCRQRSVQTYTYECTYRVAGTDIAEEKALGWSKLGGLCCVCMFVLIVNISDLSVCKVLELLFKFMCK